MAESLYGGGAHYLLLEQDPAYSVDAASLARRCSEAQARNQHLAFGGPMFWLKDDAIGEDSTAWSFSHQPESVESHPTR